MEFDLTWHDLAVCVQEVGFDKFGITDAEPFEDLIPQLENYYHKGRATGFEHPLSSARWDPRVLLPETKSIVSVALAYQTENGRQRFHPKGRSGIVSRYAWGQDYHGVFKAKLTKLAESLAKRVEREVKSLACVDTSPLVDRAVAVRAGVGWIGKNSMLITEEYGSYVFLGSLLTDLSIAPAPSKPVIEGCGDCTLCLTACPTDALVAPYELDGKRCLSAITQMKGMIPQEFRDKLGRRIWGCDTCQTVCPKNRQTLVSDSQDFEPEPELCYPGLQSLLNLTGRQFKRLYGHTAAAWRGHQVIRRNAIIALANADDHSAIPQLIDLLKDPRPEIRGSAAWALGKLDPIKGRPAVQAAFSIETDEDAKSEMVWSVASD